MAVDSKTKTLQTTGFVSAQTDGNSIYFSSSALSACSTSKPDAKTGNFKDANLECNELVLEQQIKK